MYSPQAHKNKTQPSAEVCFVTANPTPPYPPTPSYPPPHTRRAPKCAEGVQECAPEPRAPGGRGRGGRVKGAAGDQRCTEIGFAPAGAWPRLSYPTRGVHSVAVKNCLIVPGLSSPPRAADLFTLAARRPALPAHLPCAPARSSAICRLNAIVSSHAWRPGRHPRGLGA